MQQITRAQLDEDPTVYAQLAEVLADDGIVCIPAETNYRLAASVLSPKAVTSLMAAKRRSQHAPSLVFVSGHEMLEQVAGPLPELARKLGDAFWPGPLTLLVEPREDLPGKVRKALAKAKGWIGVRVPGHEVARKTLDAFGGPLLISSANLSKKKGATSPAQVKKSFGRVVDAMVDSGDLPAGEPSTLVKVQDSEFEIVRQGAVTEEQIRATVGQ